MNTSRLLATLFLAQFDATSPALALNLPVSEDTYGLTAGTGTATNSAIAAAAGKAASLPISKKGTAFIRFEAGSTGISPSTVIKAQLVVYLPSVVKTGDLGVFAVVEDWQEKFT